MITGDRRAPIRVVYRDATAVYGRTTSNPHPPPAAACGDLKCLRHNSAVNFSIRFDLRQGELARFRLLRLNANVLGGGQFMSKRSWCPLVAGTVNCSLKILAVESHRAQFFYELVEVTSCSTQ